MIIWVGAILCCGYIGMALILYLEGHILIVMDMGRVASPY
jgi:hypothetical protein